MKKELTKNGARDWILIQSALETGDPSAYARLMQLYRDPLYFINP